MTFTIRPFAPADAPQVATLLSRVLPEPVSAAEVAELDALFPRQDGAFQLLLIAADDDGEIVGWGETFRKAWHKPGKFYFDAVVDPGHRHRTIGGTLVNHLERFAREHGATELHAEVRDNDPGALSFAERRGFSRERHLFESVLTLQDFDESRFAAEVEQVQRDFRIFTLAESPGEEHERRLYELRKATMSDQPGFDGSGAPPFEQWRRQTLYGAESRHDLMLIAADGDRFVGETHLRWNEARRSMYTNYTGILPDYRGRHLALALKVLGAGIARRYGALSMRTNNDAQNGPMLAVNRRLGYRAEPGLSLLVKQM